MAGFLDQIKGVLSNAKSEADADEDVSTLDTLKGKAGDAKDKVGGLVGSMDDKMPDAVKQTYGKVSGSVKQTYGKVSEKVGDVIPGGDDGDGGESEPEGGADAGATDEG